MDYVCPSPVLHSHSLVWERLELSKFDWAERSLKQKRYISDHEQLANWCGGSGSSKFLNKIEKIMQHCFKFDDPWTSVRIVEQILAGQSDLVV